MPQTEQTLTNFKSSVTPCLFLLPDAPRFTIVDANDAYLALCNKKIKQLVGRSMFDEFSENGDDAGNKRVKAVRGCLENALRLKKPGKLRLQRYDADLNCANELTAKFWNIDAIPILNEENKLLFLVFTIVDVTGFVNQQAQFPTDGSAVADHFAHPLFNDYPDGVASLDLYGNFLSVNKIFIDQTGVNKEEALSMSFVPLIAEKDFARVFDGFQKAMKGEVQNFEAEIISGEGLARMMNLTFLPIIVNNEVLGNYLITKDLTYLKEAERQAEANRVQLTTILESITDGFFAVDNQFTVTYFNKEAERILDLERSKVIGRNLWDVFPDAKAYKFYDELNHAMEQKVSVRFEEYLPSVNVWLESAVYPNEGGVSVYFNDVTERVAAAKELEKAKERYINLFDFSPFPIWVYNADTLEFLAVNSAAVKTYGYTEEEFLQMKIGDLYPPGDMAILNRMIQEKVKTKEANKNTIQLIKKSGELLIVEIDSKPLPSWSENARIIVAQDVTEKIKAQQDLKASELRFKALVQDGSDLTAILDISGMFKYVSPSITKILNVKPERLMDRNIFEFIHIEDRHVVTEDFKRLNVVKSIRMAPFRVMDGAGQFRWVETVITDLSDDEAVAGIIINSRDVTERIINERKIKANIEHYNDISKSNNGALYDWDLTTNELQWNRGFESVFGYENGAQDMKAQWLELIHPDDRERLVDQIYLHLKEKKTRWKAHYRFLTSGGLYKAVLDRGFFVFKVDGTPERMIGAVQDITDRLTYSSDQEQQNKLLRDISWMQSHIVRAPLARILGLSDLLTYNEGQVVNAELLAHLADSAKELDQIISSILAQTDKD
jgi:PAS domain S-box-containing protein